MKHFKKFIVYIMALMLVCQTPSAAFAEEGETKEAAQESAEESAAEPQASTQTKELPLTSVVRIITGYEFDDGSFDAWTGGTGFYIGENQIMTSDGITDLRNSAAVDFSELKKEKETLYKRIGISLTNDDETMSHMVSYIVWPSGSAEKASSVRSVNGMSILTAETVPEDAAPVILESKDIIGGESALGYTQAEIEKAYEPLSYGGTAETLTPEVSATNEVDNGFIGAPIADETGAVIGMIQSRFGNNVSILSTADIQGKTSQPEEPQESGDGSDSSEESQEESSEEPGDISEPEQQDSSQTEESQNQSGTDALSEQRESLLKIVEDGRKVDLEPYTEESAEVFTSALDNAEKIAKDQKTTEKEISAAVKTITAARQGLEEKPSDGRISTKGIIILSVIGLLFLSLIGLLVRMFLLKKKEAEINEIDPFATELPKKEKKEKKNKKKKEPEDAAYGGEQARKISEKKIQNTQDVIDDGNEDTNILETEGDDDTTILKASQLIDVWLERDGKQIPITTREFIIGKERKKVNYCISGNPTVSRKHAKLYVEGEEVSIEDLNSLNHTYVNNTVLEKFEKVPLRDKDLIRMSDVNFIFHLKKKEGVK